MDFETKEMISPKNFCPDIVMYSCSWELSVWGKEYTPQSISQYALTCYIPYGFMAARIQ